MQDLTSDAEQLWLMQQHPELLSRLDLQSPLLQWYWWLRAKDSVDNEVLEKMPKSAALKTTLQLARKRPARSGGRI